MRVPTFTLRHRNHPAVFNTNGRSRTIQNVTISTLPQVRDV